MVGQRLSQFMEAKVGAFLVEVHTGFRDHFPHFIRVIAILIFRLKHLVKHHRPFHCIRNSTPSARQEDLACEAVRYNSVDLLR